MSVVTDRESGASPSDVGFRANPAERPTRLEAPSSLGGTNRGAALLGALLLHASLLSFLAYEHELTPAVAPAAREIAVEIVVEPPSEKPDAAKTEPAPTAPPPDLAPAFDAPRAANEEKIEREAPDEATKAPAAPPTAKALAPNPAREQAAAPLQQGAIDAAANAAEPALEKAAEAAETAVEADRVAPAERQARADAQPDKLPTLIGEPFPTWSAGAPIPTAESVPDIELGSAAATTPVSGGKAKATYLSIVYGMIMSHVRLPAAGRTNSSRAAGQIVFTLDGTGALVQRQIVRASGSLDLDSAALAAVAEAAPFPTPPQGAAVRLRFTYGAK
ncbi:MAG: TonB family protein [Roseiarcus sp.]|jgi:protein TonB